MTGVQVASTSLIKFNNGGFLEKKDLLTIEEPLEIRVSYGDTLRSEQSLAVTMRTPGHDTELVTGFLFTEGIIKGSKDILSMQHCKQVKPEEFGNVMSVQLLPEINFRPEQLMRNFYTSSSCGVCGKSSIAAVYQKCERIDNSIEIPIEHLQEAPNKLREAQLVFKHTGGIHAVGLFNKHGELVLLREDVGRHNAMDKLIGAVLNKQVDVNHCFVLLSGRASFELIQKAVMIGIPIVAAVGAPSSLAVKLAEATSMTLLGFVRNQSFNVYCHGYRVST